MAPSVPGRDASATRAADAGRSIRLVPIFGTLVVAFLLALVALIAIGPLDHTPSDPGAVLCPGGCGTEQARLASRQRMHRGCHPAQHRTTVARRLMLPAARRCVSRQNASPTRDQCPASRAASDVRYGCAGAGAHVGRPGGACRNAAAAVPDDAAEPARCAI